jgi:nucleoside diphosphate kinase
MILIKPDAFERKLVAKILNDFEQVGKIRRMYSGRMNAGNCAFHYADHVGKLYYPALVKQMISGISLFIDLDMYWTTARGGAIMVRDRYGVEGPRNLIHASDSEEADIRETTYWFKGYPDDSGIARREVLSQSAVLQQSVGCSVRRGRAGTALPELQQETDRLENGAKAPPGGGDQGP